MLSVLCCGCLRVMGEDGTPQGEKRLGDGPINLATLSADFAGLRTLAASFPTKEKADEGATTFGWIAENGNHRCPECYRAKAIEDAEHYRQGAYIEWD
jgi:hypothetical protein